MFTATRAPAQSEVREVAQRVHERVLGWMKRRGMLRAALDEGRADSQAPEPMEACAQLSLRLGKLGYVDERGVAHEPDADEQRFGRRGRSPWSGEHEGWNVHARVSVERTPPKRLPLVRYFGVLSSASRRTCCGAFTILTHFRARNAAAGSAPQYLGLPCEPTVIARARAPTLFDDPPPPADWDAA